jgi:hypothetical protein
MVDLLTLPINILKMSPFTVCQIATPTVALISACKNVLHGEEVIAARERIRVAIAAVERFGEVWPRAANTAKELKIIAREIFGIKKLSRSPGAMVPTSIQQYSQPTEPLSYQEFSFLDELVPNEPCDFSTTFSYGSTPAVASSSGSMSGDTSMGNVTMAY